MFREVLCTLCQLYSASTDCSEKKQMINFLVEQFDENAIWIDYQFHDPKSQEICFHTLYVRLCYLNGSYERSN